MLKTYLYIPEELDEKISLTAKLQNRSKAEVIRQALEKGITVVTHQGAASAQALLKVAEIGKTIQNTIQKYYCVIWSETGAVPECIIPICLAAA